MDGDRDGRRRLRPSFHLYLLVFTLAVFFGQIPLGLFAAQSPLDSTAHVLLAAAATSLLYDVFYRRAVHGRVEYLVTMVLLGVVAESVWEVLEFAGDAAFGSAWQVDNADTMQDIICGIVGATFGAGIRLALDRRRGRPALLDGPIGLHTLRSARFHTPASGARRTVGLVGVTVVFALAPSGYLGYLAWAVPAASATPTTTPASSIAPAVEPSPVRPVGSRPPGAASVPIPSVGATVPVGPTPGFVVVAPRGRHAYVANRGAGMVTVVDTAVDRVIATIPVPVGPPRYLAFSPDGRTAYVSVWDDARTVAAIGVLDTATNSVVTTIPMRSRPFLTAVTPDGRRLYVPNHDSGTIAVVETATNTVTAEIRLSADPHWVEFSPDGRRAYTADHESNLISIIDTATDSVVAEVRAQRSPHSVAVHPSRPLVAGVNYDSDSVTMVDTDSERVVASIPVGDGPQDVTWAPDGRFAYVADVDADTVSVVDPATMTVTATVPTGDAPTSVAVHPDGGKAYVTNLHDGTLTVLNIAG